MSRSQRQNNGEHGELNDICNAVLMALLFVLLWFKTRG